METLRINDNDSSLTDNSLATQRRQFITMKALQHAEDVVYTIAKKATSGDIQAARLLLEVAGVIRRGVNVAVQNNVGMGYTIPPDELEAMKADLDLSGD